MPAIHVILRRGGSFLVMMRRNLALTGLAAGGLVGRPCGTGERHIKKNDHEQTDACENGTPSIVTRSVHALRDPISVVRQYSVVRHSSQAGSPKQLAYLSTIRQSSESLTMTHAPLLSASAHSGGVL